MIDTTMEFILVLVVIGISGLPAGVSTETVPSFEACQAIRVQLEAERRISAYCVAKHLVNEGAE